MNVIGSINCRLSRIEGYISAKWRNHKRSIANAMIFKLVEENIKVNKNGAILCDAMWDHPYQWLRFALLRTALSKIYGNELVGIYLDNAEHDVISSLRALRPTNEEIISTDVPEEYLRLAKEMLVSVKTPDQIMQLDFPYHYPAYLFYDGVLKDELEGTIDCNNPKLVDYLGYTLYLLQVYSQIILKHQIRAVMLSHPVHFRFSTLAWVALQHNIPTFIVNYVNEHMIIRKYESCTDIYQPFEFVTEAQIKNLPFDKRNELIQFGRMYLSQLRKGKLGEFKALNIYSGDNGSFDRKELMTRLGCDENKPNVVILGNCWPDFPNALGKTYFNDYVEWFFMTMNTVKENRNINWIIKPHPAEEKYGDKISSEKMLKEADFTNYLVWPKDLSSNAMDCLADYVVTARGSAGIEYTALGKRVLVAAQTQYTHLGFVRYAKSPEEYQYILGNIADIPYPSQNQEEDACICIALCMASPIAILKNYRYPPGVLSVKLWGGVSDFIKNNQENIEKEIAMIGRWLQSGTLSYNVYKGLHSEEW